MGGYVRSGSRRLVRGSPPSVRAGGGMRGGVRSGMRGNMQAGVRRGQCSGG
jgi:hypothetical protein